MKTVPALTMSIALLAGAANAQTADWRKPDPANLLVLETTKGTVLVEMAPNVAPRHVAQIKALTRAGFYDRALFYRVIKGFMAQTGDKGLKRFTSTLPNLRREFEFAKTATTPYASLGTSAAGDTGYIGTLPVVIDADGVTGHAQHCPGVASMAHPNQAFDNGNSQIFLMRGRSPNLDGTFTAWGRVIQGQEAVDAINDGEPPPAPDLILKARIASDMPAGQRPAIEVMDTRGPAFAAVFADVVMKYGPNFNLCLVPMATRGPEAATAPAAGPPTAPPLPPSPPPAPGAAPGTGAVSVP